MQAFINRFRYQATKASQVQSRIKMLDKVVRIEIPPERKRVRFHFPQTQKSGRMVLELKQVRKAYGTTRVPYAFRTSRRSRTVRPLFAQSGNEKCTRFRSGGISIGTILSSILIRL